MKSIKVVFYLLFITSMLAAQEQKRNSVWTLGYSPVVSFKFNGSLIIDSVGPHGVSSGESCISDTNGTFLFYSSGFFLVDQSGDIMSNGSYINCPYGSILATYYGHASLFAQTSIILPRKAKTYYVFCTGMSDSVANNYLNHVYTEFDVLNYSIVDMDSNGGMGKVVQKNIVLADKQHYTNCAMQAVKHANGKDWWLVKADCRNNRYQEYLVKEDTILGPFYQNSTVIGDFCDPWRSQVYFDAMGTAMACSMYGSIFGPSNYWYDNRVEVYDFNRCDGSISFRSTYFVPQDTLTYPYPDYKSAICFSPNGKLLYMSTDYSIYQIDLEDTAQNNALFIHGPDTTLPNFPYYDLMAAAPDGKIYIGNSNGLRKFMSYIDSPNVRGLGCAFKPQGLWQPYTNLKSPPNMPNYGLGPDTSKPCWPLSLSESGESAAADECVVYPNPAQTYLTVESEAFKQGLNSLRIFNLMGQCVLEESFKTASGKHTISVRGLPAGMYVVRVNGMVRRVVVE